MKEANENMKKEPSKPVEKEIDLLEVSGNIAKSVKNGIVQLSNLLMRFVKAILIGSIKLIVLGLNSWKFVAIVLIILCGSGYLLFKTAEPYYKSEITSITRIRSNQEIIQIINSISIPNDESNVPLNNDLQLSPEVYNNVLAINASWLIDENGDGIADFADYDNEVVIDPEKDSLKVRLLDRFNIQLTVLDQTIADDVEEKLIEYLFNHPYITNLNNSRLNTIQGMVNVYENQALVLDSLQAHEYFKDAKEQNVQSLKLGDFELIGSDDMKDKRLYHTDIIDLKENAMTNQTVIQYSKEPLVFVGSLANTSDVVNSLKHYLLKVAKIIIPLALLIFILLKKDELEDIFNINKFLEK